MKRICALLLAAVLVFTAIPVLAETEPSITESIVRKAWEFMPGGSIPNVVKEVVNDNTLTTEEKYAKTMTALITEITCDMLCPSLKAIANKWAQSAVDEMRGSGVLEKPFENVSENDKRKMDMYLKALDESIDHVMDTMAGYVDTAIDTTKNTIKKAWDYVTGWF